MSSRAERIPEINPHKEGLQVVRRVTFFTPEGLSRAFTCELDTTPEEVLPLVNEGYVYFTFEYDVSGMTTIDGKKAPFTQKITPEERYYLKGERLSLEEAYKLSAEDRRNEMIDSWFNRHRASGKNVEIIHVVIRNGKNKWYLAHPDDVVFEPIRPQKAA